MNNDAKYLAFMKRTLSLSEYRTYLKSESGLRLRCQSVGWDPAHCKDELKLLSEIVQSKIEAAWKIALDETGGELEYATRIMLTWGYAPPDWKFTAECDQCGWVIVPEETPLARESCPWCNTWMGREFQKSREYIEKLSQEGIPHENAA